MWPASSLWAIILALGFMGNMVQSNSIGDSFANAFGVKTWCVGIVVALIAALIFIGGVRRIAWVTEKIVPIMALLYTVGCLFILVMNLPGVVTAIQTDFRDGLRTPVRGRRRGRHHRTEGHALRRCPRPASNEAGMGSTPHAHALANVAHPTDQGVLAMMGVFIDTFIILTMTALVILSTGSLESGLTGSALAQTAFNST